MMSKSKVNPHAEISMKALVDDTDDETSAPNWQHGEVECNIPDVKNFMLHKQCFVYQVSIA
jgi:hypothetical protein